MYYYTQLIGDAINPPTIQAAPGFDSSQGNWMLDSDPYIPGGNGANWYTNQNNFFRQVRNFVLDTTLQSATSAIACIHWQVAQATSLQNIVFNMAPKSTHQGIFMDNGSGGFMADLVFNNGGIGAFLGNQQFTTRNLTFNGCQTAIYMNWNWLWTFKSVTINNCGVGLDMSALDQQNFANQTVGSVVLMDSVITNTPIGIWTSFNDTSMTKTAGTMILQNVDCTGAAKCIVGADGSTVILAGGALIPSWGQGTLYQPEAASAKVKRVPQAASSSTDELCTSTETVGLATTVINVTASVPATSLATPVPSATTTTTSTGSNITASVAASSSGSASISATSCAASAVPVASKRSQQELTEPSIPAALLGTDGFFQRSKPQYEDVDVSNFVSIKSQGAKGDGVQDDTQAIQNAMNSITTDQILYFDHGAYLVTQPINVPKNIRMTGEIWPLIMIGGTAFQDSNNPKAVFTVGNVGDVGKVEISDLIFETQGPQPGAIMMLWNVQGANSGDVGMWDTHFRIGGSAGTNLQQDTCQGNTTNTQMYNPQCAGSYLMLQISQQATAYLENNWLWVADHELDMAGHDEVNIYNGRGMLIESQGPVWLYGTSVEHSQLYNYQVANAKNIFMGAIQTETAYMQSSPDALNAGFSPNSAFTDPTFGTCTDELCKKTWGLRVVESSDVFVYGAGLYSFFDNYQQECLATESCQENMVSLECSSSVYLYGLSTKAATNMVLVDGTSQALQSDNTNGFCQTVALFQLE